MKKGVTCTSCTLLLHGRVLASNDRGVRAGTPLVQSLISDLVVGGAPSTSANGGTLAEQIEVENQRHYAATKLILVNYLSL
jgi:hypothetical protein